MGGLIGKIIRSKFNSIQFPLAANEVNRIDPEPQNENTPFFLNPNLTSFSGLQKRKCYLQ